MITTIDNSFNSISYNLIYTQSPSAYVAFVNPDKMYAPIIKNKDIFNTENISKDKDKPCYKTFVKNINIFLLKNDIYNNSKKKLLIEENINDFICEYGQSESESISNMKEKIKYNIEMYANMKNNNKDIDKMSQIFFEILSDINHELS